MIRRLFSRAARIVLVGIVPGLVMVGASGAHPASAATNSPTLIENANLKCLEDVTNGPVMSPCDSTNSNEFWNKLPAQSGFFLIESNASGRCLSIVSHQTTAGAQVDQRACDSGDAFENWKFDNGFPPTSGFVQLANKGDGSDLVMHPSGCSSASGVLLFMNERDSCNADNWFPF